MVNTPGLEPLEPRLLLSVTYPVLCNWALTEDTGINSQDKVTRDVSPLLTFTFSEPVFGSDESVAVLDPGSSELTPEAIAGWGTDTLTLALPALPVDGTYTVLLNGDGSIRDLDLNLLNDGLTEERTFALDTSAPMLVGQPVLNQGTDAPDSRSQVRTVTLEFSEPLTVDPSDLQLRNRDTGEFVDLSSRLPGSGPLPWSSVSRWPWLRRRCSSQIGIWTNPWTRPGVSSRLWATRSSSLVEAVGNQIVVRLDEYGSDLDPQLFLADGNYELILAGPLSDTAGNLTDYDQDGIPNETAVLFAFHKQLGDFDGDRSVTEADFLLWKDRYGTFAPPSDVQFDLSGDGRVTGVDFLMWNQQYGSALAAAPDGLTYSYDIVPPEILITSPDDGAFVNEPVLTVCYTSDGVARERDFTLVEGENALLIEDTDPAGNVGSASITVILDTIPPKVLITSPQQQSVFNTTAITVDYTVDGVPQSRPATLTELQNTILVTGADEAGNQAAASVVVYYNAGMVIDPDVGGVVTSPAADGAAVAVPVGSMASPSDVSVTTLEAGQYSSADHEVASVVMFLSTEGFTSDVMITLPLDETFVPGTEVELGIVSKTTGQIELTGQKLIVNEDGVTASADVDHFSSYAALKPISTTGGAVGGAETPLPDLFTGTFSHTISINLPDGRQDMTPSLELLYRSSGGTSTVGYGWELTIPSIQRSTKNGVPSYDDTQDVFVFTYEGQSTELVKVANPLRMWGGEIEGIPDTPESTAVSFETDAGARLVDTFDIDGDDLPDRVLHDLSDPTRWWVQLNTGGGFGALALWSEGIATIGGLTESSAISYRTAEGVQLVDTFDIDGDNLPDRVLHDPSDPERWWVQLNTGVGFAALTLWADNVDSLGSAAGTTAIAYTAPEGSQAVGTFDIDGDGLPDRVLCDTSDPARWWVQLNTGVGFAALTLWADNIDSLGSAAGTTAIAYTAHEGSQTVGTFDIDGDGLPDRVLCDLSNPTKWRVQMNTGGGPGTSSGFDGLATWTMNIADVVGSPGGTAIAFTGPNGSQTVGTFDIDGDGLPDRVLHSTKDRSQWIVQRNNGSGFTAPQLWAENIPTAGGHSGYAGIAYGAPAGSGRVVSALDINGDGLPDRVLRNEANPSQWLAQLNSGSGFDAVYEAKIESSFHRFYKEAGDQWRVVTKEGLELLFGGTAESRVTGTSGTGAWYITKATDPNANYITYAYTQDQNQVYPSQIEYTGNETTGALPAYSVNFMTEARPDVNSSYILGAGVSTARRIRQIEVVAEGNLVRRYALEYVAGVLTGRSLLKTVRTYGSDGATEGPPITLTYHEGQMALAGESSSLWVPDCPWGVASADVDDDGLLDLVVVRSLADTSSTACLGAGLTGVANRIWQPPTTLGVWRLATSTRTVVWTSRCRSITAVAWGSSTVRLAAGSVAARTCRWAPGRSGWWRRIWTPTGMWIWR